MVSAGRGAPLAIRYPGLTHARIPPDIVLIPTLCVTTRSAHRFLRCVTEARCGNPNEGDMR